MDADTVFAAVPYIYLLRPDVEREEIRAAGRSVRALAPVVPAATTRELLNGTSWRERLVGLAIGVIQGPGQFTGDIVDSLRSPRGLAIVPSAAALVLAARESGAADLPTEVATLNRSAFEGTVGWALDMARFLLGASDYNPGGTSPYYGIRIEEHLSFYEWLVSPGETT
jgi:hypothetical protein